MLANKRFLKQPPAFWANVRAISETLVYTDRGQRTVKVPTISEMASAMARRSLCSGHIVTEGGVSTELGRLLRSYFAFRSRALTRHIEPHLMDAKQAKQEFEKLRAKLSPPQSCPMPMNKQKGSKRQPAYLTCMVNMIINAHATGMPCDYNPRRLTTITENNAPLRTLSRRVDGAFPSTVDPLAVWEIKEYYHTTTFGSRVADAVYETLLDGMELAEMRENEGRHVRHYLIVDAHYTWWKCGRSYLCRIIDALHMGYIDDVLFGYEVIERLPKIVRDWVRLAKKTHQRSVGCR